MILDDVAPVTFENETAASGHIVKPEVKEDEDEDRKVKME